MRLELFQNFIAVVEHGTITAAAREINIAQPALSAQLRTLEEELGVLLLKRDTRNVELTEAGRMLYSRGKELCRIESDLRQELQDHALGMSSAFRIGISDTLPPAFVNRLLAHRTLNSIRFSIYNSCTADLWLMLRDGAIELGIAEGSLPSGLQMLLSVPESLSVVYSANRARFSKLKESCSIADLHSVPLCLSRRTENIFRQLCSEEGFVPNVRCVSDTLQCLQFLAEQGLAVAVLYRSETDELPGQLRCQPLTVPEHLASQRVFAVRKGTKLSSNCEMLLKCACQMYG